LAFSFYSIALRGAARASTRWRELSMRNGGRPSSIHVEDQSMGTRGLKATGCIARRLPKGERRADCLPLIIASLTSLTHRGLLKPPPVKLAKGCPAECPRFCRKETPPCGPALPPPPGTSGSKRFLLVYASPRHNMTPSLRCSIVGILRLRCLGMLCVAISSCFVNRTSDIMERVG